MFLSKIFNRTKAPTSFSSYVSPISTSGEVVTVENSTNLGIVYACINVKASAIAKLPLQVFVKTKDGRTRDHAHRISYLLETRPNPHMSPYMFKFVMMVHRETYGAAFIRMKFNRKGLVESLHLMYPSSVSIIEDIEGKVFYVETMNDNTQQVYSEDEVIFIPAFTTDGYNIKSPITVARETIGIIRSQEKFLGSYYQNGTLARGVIKVPTTLNKEAKEKVREEFQKMNAGMQNASKVAVLDEGFDYQNITIPLGDSEFIASQNFSLRQICRIYGIPPHMVGDLERSTFNNIEQMSMDFVLNTLQPICVSIEEEMDYKIFNKQEQQKGYYVKFNLTSALRADSKSRAEYMQLMIRNGLLTTNEGRKLEDLEPIKDGDRLLISQDLTHLDNLENLQSSKGGE
ncbi:phage portal protein [Sutcliffiella horikoshii]|uniref:phage portal protein n=1 Tax=Sutcliffiella horikoshii TaxID=79883 RepID=UPI003CF3D7D4